MQFSLSPSLFDRLHCAVGIDPTTAFVVPVSILGGVNLKADWPATAKWQGWGGLLAFRKSHVSSSTKIKGVRNPSTIKEAHSSNDKKIKNYGFESKIRTHSLVGQVVHLAVMKWVPKFYDKCFILFFWLMSFPKSKKSFACGVGIDSW